MMFYDKINCPSLKFYVNFPCKPKHLFVVSFQTTLRCESVCKRDMSRGLWFVKYKLFMFFMYGYLEASFV